MKKLIVLLMLPTMLLAFAGCADHRNSDISNRVVLQGIGVDYEDQEYVLTIQVFNLTRASPSGVETSENVTSLYTTRGKTVSEAVDGLRRFIGKKPMFSHNRILIVSEAAATAGLNNILDYFVRDYSTRPSVDFAITRGKASDILGADFGNATIPAEEIARLLETQSKKARVQVMNIVNRYLEPGIDPVAPLLEIIGEEPKDGTSVSAAGIAVLQDDRVIGYLDVVQAQMLLILDGNIKSNTIDLSIPDFGNVGLYFVTCDSNYDVGLRDGKPYADISGSLRFDISEIQNTPHLLSEEDIEKIRQAIEYQLENSCRQVLDILLKDYQSDVLGLGRRMMVSETEYFKSVSSHWRDLLPEIETSVDLDISIRHVGRENIRTDQ